MRVLILVLILFVAGYTAHAITYSNDSDSIDINYSGGAPAPEDGGSEEEGESEGEDGSSESPLDEENGGTDDSDNTTLNEEAPDVTVPVTVFTGGNGDGSSIESSSGTGVGEDILNSLFGNQALFFGGGSGGVPESITLSGDDVRKALRARSISKLSLTDLLNKRFQSKKDFALVAASTILENEAIEEVILTLDTLTLTYRSEGRLFAVFPLSYPITLSLNPRAETLETRVTVKFPWYRFFLRTYVSRADLVRDLNTAIERAATEDMDSIDAKTRLMIEVTSTLQARFDTIQGSLR